MNRTIIGITVFALLMLFQTDAALARTTHHAAHAPAPAYKQPSSNRVVHIQKQLAAMGHYTGPIDGLFGPQTKDGLSNFQREKGLFVSGSATRETLALLNGSADREAIPVGSWGKPLAQNIGYTRLEMPTGTQKAGGTDIRAGMCQPGAIQTAFHDPRANDYRRGLCR